MYANQQVTIRHQFGYWDCTEFPIGGDFRRAGAGGLRVTLTEELETACHGAKYLGVTADGRKVAFSPHAFEPSSVEA